MALELDITINNTTAAETVNFECKTVAGLVVSSGTTPVAIDGKVNISMAGRGVALSQQIKTAFNDFDGSNFAVTKDAVGWSVVTDDGALPPSVYTLLAAGDSMTATGNISTGIRPSRGNVTMFLSNYWCTAAYLHSTQDYIYRFDMGKSGESTTGMVNKLTQYTDSDADLVMLNIGTNDFLQVSIETTKTNYTTIVNALLASGKKVLCIPCHHRNNGAESAAKNLKADELNAHIQTIADANADVVMSPVDTDMNALMMAHGNDGVVSDDGLHWNNLGGILAGVLPAQTLDANFPSTINKVNLAPPAFSGTGGQNPTGGVVPDGYYGGLASNTTEDGFTGPIDRGDGKVWWKVRTNGGTVASQNNQSVFRLNAVPTMVGKNVCEFLVEFEQGAEVVNRVEVTANSSGSTWNQGDFNTETIVSSAGMVENGVKYHFRSPSALMELDTGIAQFETRQDAGVDVIYYITDVKFYQVEDNLDL